MWHTVGLQQVQLIIIAHKHLEKYLKVHESMKKESLTFLPRFAAFPLWDHHGIMSMYNLAGCFLHLAFFCEHLLLFFKHRIFNVYKVFHKLTYHNLFNYVPIVAIQFVFPVFSPFVNILAHRSLPARLIIFLG